MGSYVEIVKGRRFVPSFTLGAVGSGMGAVVSSLIGKWPRFTRLLTSWFKEGCPDAFFTSIQVNGSFHCADHVDAGNAGPS